METTGRSGDDLVVFSLLVLGGMVVAVRVETEVEKLQVWPRFA